LDGACHCHLTVADREMKMAAGGVRHLNASFFGGLE
jgi:hypothetical protein